MVKASARQNKATKAYLRLRELILSGEIQSGERLVESKLAKKLGMSRGPIRESLLRLESEGLLRSRGIQRSRVIVLEETPDWGDLLARYELREQIEAGAARLAAKNMNGWQIDQLRALAMEIDKCEESGDADAKWDAVERFHEHLVMNCGNPLFAQVYETHRLMPARPISNELEQRVLAYIEPDRRNNQNIGEVVDAIAAHDPEQAELAIKTRIRSVTEALRKLHHQMTAK